MSRTESTTTFGTWVARCRKAANLSQEDLAAMIGYTRTSVANLEANRGHVDGPSVGLIIRLADALGVPPSSVFKAAVAGCQLRPADKVKAVKLRTLRHEQDTVRAEMRRLSRRLKEITKETKT